MVSDEQQPLVLCALALTRGVPLAVGRATALARRLHGRVRALRLDPVRGRAWLSGADDTTPSSPPRGWLTTGALLLRGDWLRWTILQVVRETRPSVLVLPADRWVTAGLALDLATEASVPVLVARAGDTAKRILAATDLRDPQLPLVAGAASWASQVDAALVVAHDGAADAGALAAASRALGVDAQVQLTTTSDPAGAVVELARAADADLVMVGARRRPWWDLRPRPKVAEQVLADAAASVLVVPLRARDPLEPLVR